MPGLRFLYLSEMQQNKLSKTAKGSGQSSRKCRTARNLRKLSLIAKFASEPSTPDKELVHRSFWKVCALPGSLIHLFQSEDGKLRWDPPSSASSLTKSRAHSGCFSAERGLPIQARPVLMRPEVKAVLKFLSNHTMKAEPATPSLTSCLNFATSDTSIICFTYC
ncbi:hypothetical protein L7F22_041326 [Adiantum nelumboides]|nr:hypothetical protein [Adiantum nelumboides]